MDNLVLHPLSRRQLEQFVDNPRHAVQIVGPSGIGKLTVARQLTAQLIGLTAEKLDNYAYFLHLQPEKQVISIDMIRQAQRFLQHKTIGSGEIRRVMLVENAHAMTPEAQNAFLKSLEEPPVDTIIILTVSQPEQLLATITSRVQTLSIHVPPVSNLQAHFGSQNGFQHAYRLSGGLPGLLTALLAADQTHTLFAAVEQAKELLGAALFSRLAAVDGFIADRESVPELLTAVERIAQTGLEQAAVQQPTRIARWQRALRAAHEANAALEHNANLKLTLTQFMLVC